MHPRVNKPANNPTTIATMEKGSGMGLNVLHTIFARPPVAAPAHGPASTPTNTVPIESRYTGNPSVGASCPSTMLSAIPIGIST